MIVSRYGDLHVLGLDLDAELARQALERDRRGASRPCRAAASGASPALRSRRSTGSSSWSRCSAFASLSSSPFDFAWIATASTGVGRRERLDRRCSAPRAPSTSPVRGVGELGDGGDVAGRRPRSTGSCSLPRIVEELVQALVVHRCGRSRASSSGFTVPCSTLNRFTCPTYGSTIVLNTNAAGGPSPPSSVRRGTLLDEERARAGRCR